jgi:hypothetical protein
VWAWSSTVSTPAETRTVTRPAGGLHFAALSSRLLIARSIAAASPTTRHGRYLLGTGGGITVHSDVAEEYAESRWKAERLLRVFDGPTTESARPARAPSTPTP